MESIKQRNILVDKLVEKLSNEYETEKMKLFESITDQIELLLKSKTADLDATMDYLSFRTTFLSWIKHYLIDTNGQYFRVYRQSDGADNAVFWVHVDCINILLNKENTLAHIADGFTWDLDGLKCLFTVDETNLDYTLASVLDYVIHRTQSKKGD